MSKSINKAFVVVQKQISISVILESKFGPIQSPTQSKVSKCGV